MSLPQPYNQDQSELHGPTRAPELQDQPEPHPNRIVSKSKNGLLEPIVYVQPKDRILFAK